MFSKFDSFFQNNPSVKQMAVINFPVFLYFLTIFAHGQTSKQKQFLYNAFIQWGFLATFLASTGYFYIR